MGTEGSEDDFGFASTLGLTGYVYPSTFTKTNTSGQQPIGMFYGKCVVTDMQYGVLLCTYEIYLYTSGDYEIGGLIVNGPVESPTSSNLVTGAEYDFEDFSSGVMTTLEDPEVPILYTHIALW